MAIDKALYQAPVGIDEAAALEAPIEIEIEDPESVTIGMGGLEVVLEPGEEGDEEGFNDNLAEYLDDGVLNELAGDLIGDFDADIGSRKDWMQTYVDGLELLGLKIEERTAVRSTREIPSRDNDVDFPCSWASKNFNHR